jgi:hypothetical protein
MIAIAFGIALISDHQAKGVKCVDLDTMHFMHGLGTNFLD